jgi:hypothetical protein
MTEDERRRWIEESKRAALAPWDHKRGLGITDRNGHAVHVRAGVEETAAVLARTAVRWEKDVLDKPVCPGSQNFIVFRLRGHCWTDIVGTAWDAPDVQSLSRNLITQAIDFTVSDTSGCIGYTFYDKGERLDHFST